MDDSSIGLQRGTVRVVPYDPAWAALFEEEAARLRAALGEHVLAVEHAGSTSIPGLHAKPILDLMVAVPSLAGAAAELMARVEALGYTHRPDPEVPDRIFFAKGPTERRTHHLSLAEPGSDFWRRTLLFRDYLRAHPEAAEQYRALKLELAARYPADRTAYTDGKAALVEALLARARQESTRP